jgi:hypothetical protein
MVASILPTIRKAFFCNAPTLHRKTCPQVVSIQLDYIYYHRVYKNDINTPVLSIKQTLLTQDILVKVLINCHYLEVKAFLLVTVPLSLAIAPNNK